MIRRKRCADRRPILFQPMDEPNMSSSDRQVDLVVVVGALIALNLANRFLPSSWPEAIIQVVVAISLVGFAFRRGYTAASLGLSRATVGAGVRLGAIISAVIVVSVVVLAVAPFGRGFLDDERFTDMSGWSAVYELAIRIPIVTALSEELMFRSVLLIVLLGLLSKTWAVVWCSACFGAWHILTTVGDLADNATTDSLDVLGQIGAVLGVVAATAIAGVVFAWARLRSSSIVAPWLIHTTLNGATFAAGLIVAA